MDELFTAANTPWLLGAAVVVLLLGWYLYRRNQGGSRLKRVLGEISHDRIDGLLIPNGDDGEIQIDHLLLTSQGLLIVDIKLSSATNAVTRFPIRRQHCTTALPQSGISFARYRLRAAYCFSMVRSSPRVYRVWLVISTSCWTSSVRPTSLQRNSRSRHSNRTGI